MEQVSVIIPAYKAEGTIIKAVTSALEQGSCICEVIVVIDGVFDTTAEMLKEVVDDRLKVIIFKNNKGAQVARNKGLREAIGEYVIFLDSDDYFEGQLIEPMCSISNKSNYELCFAPNSSKTQQGNISYFKLPSDIQRFDLLVGRVLSTMAVGIQCILWRKSFLVKIGGWDEDVVRNQDGELVIRALTHGINFGISESGSGCSVQYDGDRVSLTRSLASFMTQDKIYLTLTEHINSDKLIKKEKKVLLAALNWFCINICVGMSQYGFLGTEYKFWCNKINWKFEYFFLLPRKKTLQVLVFFMFGNKAYLINNLLKKLSKQ